MTHTDNTPEAYEAPSVHAYGTVAAITAEEACGDNTDAVFPAGTPFGQITCS